MTAILGSLPGFALGAVLFYLSVLPLWTLISSYCMSAIGVRHNGRQVPPGSRVPLTWLQYGTCCFGMCSGARQSPGDSPGQQGASWPPVDGGDGTDVPERSARSGAGGRQVLTPQGPTPPALHHDALDFHPAMVMPVDSVSLFVPAMDAGVMLHGLPLPDTFTPRLAAQPHIRAVPTGC